MKNKKELIKENNFLRKENARLRNSLEQYIHMTLYFSDHKMLEEDTIFMNIEIKIEGNSDDGVFGNNHITNELFKNNVIYINTIKYERSKEQSHLKEERK